MITTDFVEGVSKVNLEQAELRLLVSLEGVAKGVSDNLDTSWAPYAVVAAFESFGDLLISGDTEAFCNQSAERIPAGKAVADFSRPIETPPATNGLRKPGAEPEAKLFTALVRALVKLNDSARTHCCNRRGL